MLLMSTLMVLTMCPLMSLVATLMFKDTHHLLINWGKTFLANLPMAFFWQLAVAGPLVRWLYRRLFALPSR